MRIHVRMKRSLYLFLRRLFVGCTSVPERVRYRWENDGEVEDDNTSCFRLPNLIYQDVVPSG